jgi:hypothetical protein
LFFFHNFARGLLNGAVLLISAVFGSCAAQKARKCSQSNSCANFIHKESYGTKILIFMGLFKSLISFSVDL